MAQATNLTDLPSDILYSIFPYLSAAEFLKLTSSTRVLFSYREDHTYWHSLTRKTFRIPPQPLLQAAQWRWLYQKLLIQTRLYTWGDNKCGNLGHAALKQTPGTIGARPRPGAGFARLRSSGYVAHSGWPRTAVVGEAVGIIADVQCGGWSTTILNSLGAIYMFGIFDGRTTGRQTHVTLRRLEFPPGYPPTTNDRYEPSTAIEQYSTGRSSVLGLADDGKVWMWEQDTGFQVKLVHVDLLANKVERVVAGWDRNSMYVAGVGIVYWASVQDSDILQGGRREALPVHDTMLIESATIPGTGFRRRKYEQDSNDTLESRVGRVTNHIVLAGYIVFTTDRNKIFFYRIKLPVPAFDIPHPIELTTFYNTSPDQTFRIKDIQGAFARFAVFTDSGNVIMGTEDMLDAFHRAFTTSSPDAPIQLPPPIIIPSLQSKTIISLAFGDHHFHALHSNGTITSYGHEPQGCGALGLGDGEKSILRGAYYVQNAFFGNERLPDGEGRTVWFDPLMEDWLQDFGAKAAVDAEAEEGLTRLNIGDRGARQAYADYFETEGAKWEDDVTKQGEMGAYFVLKVAAAGWHSAALVLVDDEKAERARAAHVLKPPPAKPRDPSPAGSLQSNDSYFHIDSPGEQLSNAVYAIYETLWEFGRWFLGLTQRDAAAAAARQAAAASNDGSDMDDEGIAPTYTWTNSAFPRQLRLRLRSEDIMRDETPLTE